MMNKLKWKVTRPRLEINRGLLKIRCRRILTNVVIHELTLILSLTGICILKKIQVQGKRHIKIQTLYYNVKLDVRTVPEDNQHTNVSQYARFHSVMVIISVFESGDPSSILGETSSFSFLFFACVT